MLASRRHPCAHRRAGGEAIVYEYYATRRECRGRSFTPVRPFTPPQLPGFRGDDIVERIRWYAGHLEETVKGVENVRSYPPVRIWFSGVSEYTLDFMIWAYIDVDFGFSTQSNIRRAVHATLAEEGVDIPLPQTDVNLKNPEDPRDATEFLGDTNQ